MKRLGMLFTLKYYKNPELTCGTSVARRSLCAGGDSSDVSTSPTTLIIISVLCSGYLKRHGQHKPYTARRLAKSPFLYIYDYAYDNHVPTDILGYII